MKSRAMLVGNSDGIGLASTRRLLAAGWDVIGVSKSESPITSTAYHHRVADVSDNEYSELIDEFVLNSPLDLCIYLVGIGDPLDPLDMNGEAKIIDVNLTGMVRTAASVIPRMVERGKGHFIGVSRLADELLSAEAPSYHASKAGFPTILEVWHWL
jgi:short-subunit dehydrogenase